MQKQYLIGLLILCFSVNGKLTAGNYLPCGSATGNSLVPSTTPDLPLGRTYNVSVGSSCDYFVPDMRIFWMSRTGRGWRQFGSIRQIPAPGTRVVLPPGGCANQTVQVTLTVDFHFNNGTLVNPRDDRYCSVDLVDRFIVEDKLPPVARSVSISTTNPDFSAGALKSLFTASAFTDNCTPLATLQNNLELVTDPRRPAIVDIRCGSTNTYRVSFRTRDACGNYSNWAIATITFRDGQAPVFGGVLAGLFRLDDECMIRIKPGFLPLPGGVEVPNTFYVNFVDDNTASSALVHSFRIISPAALAGEIPMDGRVISRAGFCPASIDLTVRVCAQDCFGNGSLYLGSNSEAGVGINCTLLTLSLVDTRRPRWLELCGDTLDVASDPFCQGVMPNLVPDLTWLDGCTTSSDLTVYQYPAPGSILNDGLDNDVGLGQGIPRSYNCVVSKPSDPVVACGSTGDLKTLKLIAVHFIIIDCDGNCHSIEGCRTINLIKSPGAMDPLMAREQRSLLSAGKTTKAETSLILLTNVPNPFRDFTDIRISGVGEGPGILHFYSSEGRILYSKKIDALNSPSIRIQRKDLQIEGLVFYRLEYTDPRTGRLRTLVNKLLIQ